MMKSLIPKKRKLVQLQQAHQFATHVFRFILGARLLADTTHQYTIFKECSFGTHLGWVQEEVLMTHTVLFRIEWWVKLMFQAYPNADQVPWIAMILWVTREADHIAIGNQALQSLQNRARIRAEFSYPRITAAFWKRDLLLFPCCRIMRLVVGQRFPSIYITTPKSCTYSDPKTRWPRIARIWDVFPMHPTPIWWPRWTICLQKLISNNDDDTMTMILFTMTVKTNFISCHDTSPTSDAWHRALTHKLIAVGSLGPKTMKRTWAATCSSPG